jgi:hypothetical protein
LGAPACAEAEPELELHDTVENAVVNINSQASNRVERFIGQKIRNSTLALNVPLTGIQR